MLAVIACSTQVVPTVLSSCLFSSIAEHTPGTGAIWVRLPAEALRADAFA